MTIACVKIQTHMNFSNIIYEQNAWLVKHAQNFNQIKRKLIFKHQKSIEKIMNMV
jgi:hypothetical protein